MSEGTPTGTNAGATIAGVILGLVLIWVFGYASAAVYHSIGGGAFGLLIGAALAFASGYGAAAIPKAAMPAASVSAIKFAVIALTAINFLMYVSGMGPASMISGACSIIGAAIVGRRSVTTLKE